MRVRRSAFADVVARTSPGAPFSAVVHSVETTGRYRPVDYVEFLAVLAGAGVWTATSDDGRRTTTPLLPGALGVLLPGDTHEVSRTSTRTVRVASVVLPTTAWDRFTRMTELDDAWSLRPFPSSDRLPGDSARVLEPFHTVLDRVRAGTRAIDLIEFLTAIVVLILPEDVGEAERAPSWLVQVRAAMTREGDLRGGVPRLVEIAGVSRAQLWRTLRQHTGLSPNEFVRTAQLRHAASLLRAGDASIASIAERCGFSSTSYFSRAFSRFHGSSPRAYRALARSAHATGVT